MLDLLQLRFYDFSEKVRKSASVEWVKPEKCGFFTPSKLPKPGLLPT